MPPEAFGNGVGGGRGRLLGLAAQAFGRRLELGHGLQGPSPTRCAAAPFAPVLFTAALRVGGRRSGAWSVWGLKALCVARPWTWAFLALCCPPSGALLGPRPEMLRCLAKTAKTQLLDSPNNDSSTLRLLGRMPSQRRTWAFSFGFDASVGLLHLHVLRFGFGALGAL